MTSSRWFLTFLSQTTRDCNESAKGGEHYSRRGRKQRQRRQDQNCSGYQPV